MDPRLNQAGGLRPVDKAVAAWNGVAAAAWLVAAMRAAAAPAGAATAAAAAPGATAPAAAAAAPPAAAAIAWATLHAAAAILLPLALRRCGAPGRAPLGWLRDTYPWLAWALAWRELGALHAATAAATHDAVIARLDQALFGGPWHRSWALAAPQRWLREAAHLAYLSYFALILVMPLRALARRRGGEFREATTGLVATYLGCFAVSLALPVYGPRLAEGAGAGPGLFAGVAAALRAAGDSPGTAFPSSHCAASVASACLAWRAGARRLAAWLAAWAAAVVLSTIYTGNHYALDALAGSAWALLLNAALGARRAPRRARSQAPGRRPAAVPGGERTWPSRS